VKDPWSLAFCALQHYGKGEFEKALNVLDRSEQRPFAVVVYRILILAELPDGQSRAWRAYQDLLDRSEPAGNATKAHVVLVPYILLRLGRPLEARAAARQVLQHPEFILKTRREWRLRQQEFYAGLVSEDRLLQGAKGSKWSLCEGHFSVGLSRLARGDRTGAREHFRLALAARTYLCFEYGWARAFLARMDQDPNWPGTPPMAP
jgi:hypothetical protein